MKNQTRVLPIVAMGWLGLGMLGMVDAAPTPRPTTTATPVPGLEEKVPPEVAEQGARALADGAWAMLEAANAKLMPPARWSEANKQALHDWSERERVRLLGVADQAEEFR